MTDQTRKAGSSAATTAPKEKDAATGGEKRSETPKEHQDHALDEGIEESFPASDPVAVKITK
jgi:hypothetical protein